MYSVRMRAAQGGSHEQGGRHISGAERIVAHDEIADMTRTMLERATTHTRGTADFINIIVEKIQSHQIREVSLLPVAAAVSIDVVMGHEIARKALGEAGVSDMAAQNGMTALLSLTDSMRGAMICCGITGRRLDDTGMRGVRVSRMDIRDESGFTKMLIQQGIDNTHVREALVLASKVAACPGIMAELCWSDDPEYTTGYVASPAGYLRIPHCKPVGSLMGGRVFFVRPDSPLPLMIEYLEHQAVLVEVGQKG